MTVANIRDTDEQGCSEIMFLESAKFYTFDRNNRKYKKLLTLFLEAMSKGSPVEVELESVDSDIILEATIL